MKSCSLTMLGSGDVTESDIDGLSIFRFMKHPKLIAKIQVNCSSLKP